MDYFAADTTTAPPAIAMRESINNIREHKFDPLNKTENDNGSKLQVRKEMKVRKGSMHNVDEIKSKKPSIPIYGEQIVKVAADYGTKDSFYGSGYKTFVN